MAGETSRAKALDAVSSRVNRAICEWLVEFQLIIYSGLLFSEKTSCSVILFLKSYHKSQVVSSFFKSGLMSSEKHPQLEDGE